MKELGYKIECFPENENCGADLIGRPTKESTALKKQVETIVVFDVEWTDKGDRHRSIFRNLDSRAKIPCRNLRKLLGMICRGWKT